MKNSTTQRTKGDLYRPVDAHKTNGLHGPPPSGYPSYCFLLDDNYYTNGEVWFYKSIAPYIDRIYDVGADTTFYKNFDGEVHYFEPLEESNIFNFEKEILNGNNTLGNKKSFFNNYGLSNLNGDATRITWEAGDVCPNPEGEDRLLGNNIYMKTRRAENYVNEHNHDKIGLVKIDVEGHELEVMQGFGEKLKNVCFLQFEHGGTTYSAGHKLSEIIEYLSNQGFWGFCYLNMTPSSYRSQVLQEIYKGNINASQGGLTPLNWNKNSEDHYAYCNIVCVNKRYLDRGQAWTLDVVDDSALIPKTQRHTLLWPG